LPRLAFQIRPLDREMSIVEATPNDQFPVALKLRFDPVRS